MKNKIYYFFDPLCGWCFGFSPVIKKLEETYKDQISFEALCGGMILGDRIKPLSEMKDYLTEAMPRLEEMTGVRFGKEYLKVFEKGDLMLNSETPSIAMMVFKSMSSGSTVRFARALQNSLYVDGNNLNLLENYRSIAKEFDLDWDVFKGKMEQESYKKKAYEEFQLSAKTGVQGFPSVILQIEDQAYLIARGYRPFEDLKSTIDEIIKKGEG